MYVHRYYTYVLTITIGSSKFSSCVLISSSSLSLSKTKMSVLFILLIDVFAIDGKIKRQCGRETFKLNGKDTSILLNTNWYISYVIIINMHKFSTSQMHTIYSCTYFNCCGDGEKMFNFFAICMFKRYFDSLLWYLWLLLIKFYPQFFSQFLYLLHRYVRM